MLLLWQKFSKKPLYWLKDPQKYSYEWSFTTLPLDGQWNRLMISCQLNFHSGPGSGCIYFPACRSWVPFKLHIYKGAFKPLAVLMQPVLEPCLQITSTSRFKLHRSTTLLPSNWPRNLEIHFLGTVSQSIFLIRYLGHFYSIEPKIRCCFCYNL